ncbi:MAG: aldehyde dehydrogenase family protein [Bdellovibrionales bacterium]|nr:aldehyde dehydrogenase family protein [Bdellovibrionales bacterium]
MRSFGLYVNGQYTPSGSFRPVTPPAGDSEAFAQVAYLEHTESGEILEAVLEGAHLSFGQVQRGFFLLHERLAFLERLRAKLEANLDFCAQMISREVAKPIRLARVEVQRSLATIDWTLQEAPRLFAAQGLPTPARAQWTGLEAWTLREPRGPLLAITPFNFPLNLVMHKVVPALVTGCPVILKPSPKSAAVALALADLCHAADLPAGMLSVVNADNEVTARLIQDERVAQVSFTGSAAVGWKIAAGLTKPCFLELGGNASAYIDASADLEHAADAVVLGGMSYAGQVCIGLQNVSAHPAVLNEFRTLLADRVRKLPWGRPADERTVASCLIDRAAAARCEKLRTDALRQGARLVAETDGALDLTAEQLAQAGTYVRPALFEGVPFDSPLVSEELFGPYLNLFAEDFDAWVKRVNAGKYRFQVAVFTRDLAQTFRATRELQFGAVLVNESTSLRLEPMPFGGRGLSGTGHEGPRYAMESFTELKSVIVRP